MKLKRQDLISAMEKELLLSAFGLHGSNREPNFERERDILAKSFEMFQVCLEYLKFCKPIKTINPRVGSSYGLKHEVERWSGVYVHNGAFIAAVIHAGIKYKIIPGSPNISLAISSKLPEEKCSLDLTNARDLFPSSSNQ
ncbi:MAG: hypothetical protein WAW37_12000 [Syntrophobacteraceae bacterium]